MGQTVKAKGFYQQGLEISKKRAAADPNDSEAQRDLSSSYHYMGKVSLQQGQPAEAKGFFQHGLDIRKKRADADPKDSTAQRDLSISYDQLGNVSLQMGQPPEAKGFYQQALEIRKKRAGADPKDSEAQRDLATSYERLGNVSVKLGLTSEAKGFYQQVLDISKKRADADPKDFQAQRDLAVSYFKLAAMEEETPDHAQARKAYEQAVLVLDPWDKAGTLKGTPNAGALPFFRNKIVFCRLVEEILADENVAFKYPPKSTRPLLMLRAKELARKNDLTEAAASADRLAGLKDPQGEAVFFAGRAYGYMAGVAGAKGEPHAERAMQLLQEARRRGSFDLPANRKVLKSSHDFEPLRKRADFAKLQAQIAADVGRVVLEKKGKLLATDPVDRVLTKSPHQVHALKLTVGKRYAIALDRAANAAKWDPFLRVADSAGKEVARDDDSGGDLNAFLVFIPEQTAEYRIIVTSFDGSVGPYVLTVRERE